jgi:eukaryotic-like serine/threonine-protein kinase
MARAGDVVGGKYRLIHPLGIGGMGAVWRAEHVALKQHVAVKLLDARGPNAERSVRRFQREAQIAASIHHRNVVYISDFGVAAGEPYLVMELLQGVPLSERMVVGEPMTVAAFLRMMEEVLLGLRAVHVGGVVHRDIKPENVFLVREPDGSILPKLLDFGVSRSTEHGQGHTITREGVVMGTPEYVSPEQARGRPSDARSDLYSLGVLIYEALAGRLPFQADNAADLIVATLNAQPVPLASLREDLGAELHQLVSKAMARNPDERFQSADEMRAEIARVLSRCPHLEHLALPRRFVDPTSVNSQYATGPAGALSATLSIDPSEVGAGRRPRRAVLAAVGFAAVLLAYAGYGRLRAEERPSPRSTALEAPRGPEPVAPQPTATPAPSPEVTVVLEHLPRGAEVRVDGKAVVAGDVRLPRGSGVHAISVRPRGKGADMLIEHDARSDGHYDVGVLVAPRMTAPAAASAPAAKPSAKPARPAAKNDKTATGLMRRPDF